MIADTTPDPKYATPHQAALAYAAHGLRVVPIGPGSKYPVGLNSWQTAATTDPTIINAWWTGLYRDHGVGIALGDGLFAVDVDEHDPAASGGTTLAYLEHEHGPLPATWEAITGAGGRHLIYRCPPGVTPRNDAGVRLGPGVDIRGTGGQIVAAPTLHPTTGRPYTWVPGHAPGDMPCADAPAWLLEMLHPEPAPPPETSGRPLTRTEQAQATNPSGSSSAPDPGPADWWNDHTTWPELLTADGWIHDRTDPTGEQYWVRPGKHPRDGWSATVGHKGLDILIMFSTSVPWLPSGAYSRFQYLAARDHQGDYRAAARAVLRRMPTPPPIRILGAPAPDNEEEEEEEEEEEKESFWIDWDEFWAGDLAGGEDWILEPVLPAARGCAIHAQGGTGKSLLALWLAVHIATGRACLHQPAGEPQHVVYADYEMTASDIHDRLEAMGVDRSTDLSHLHYALLPDLPPLDTAEGARALLGRVREVGAVYVVIDTMARAIAGDENEADTIRSYYRHTGRALKKADIGSVRLDHTGKDPDKGARGSSAKRDDVDLVWALLPRNNGGYGLKAEKRRGDWMPETVELVREPGEDLGWRTAGRSVEMWPAGTTDLAGILDRLGVPVGAPVNQATAALREAGEPRRRAAVSKAVKWRRLAAQTAAQNDMKLIGNPSGNRPPDGPPGTVREPSGTETQNPRSETREPSGNRGNRGPAGEREPGGSLYGNPRFTPQPGPGLEPPEIDPGSLI